MRALEVLRAQLPDWAVDARLNLQAVLTQGSLTTAQRWGVAVAVSVAVRNAALRDAVLADAREAVEGAVIDDALAAASVMAMNNVFYRFRHMIGKPSYGDKPARLRMNRLARVAGSKVDFELCCLAVSAVNGCEACVRSHEAVVLQGGLTEDHVNDAVRLAAVLQSVGVSLEAATPPATPSAAPAG